MNCFDVPMNSLTKALTVLFSVLSVSTFSQIRQSIASGLFNDIAVWDCSCVPANNESIVISTGDTVQLVAGITMTDVTVNSSAVLDNQANNLNITGAYVINGLHQGSGRITMTGNANTVDGTGEVAITNQWRFQNGTDTILATANISRTSGGQIRVVNNDSVINYGTIISERNFVGGGANAVWINETGSTISTERAMFTNGRLFASAVNNTVIYADLAGNQTVKTAENNTYYHLESSGSANKNLSANIIILGNLTLNGGNFNTNSFDVELGGNFTNTAGVYSEGTGLTTFNGTSDQTITPGVNENFYDFTINNSSGDIILAGDLSISDTLRMTSGNVQTNSNTLTLGTSVSSTGALAYSSGRIIGSFERWINTAGSSTLFPMGTSSNYLPFDIFFNTLTAGSMTVSFNETLPGNDGLPAFDATDSVHSAFIEGFWDVQIGNGLVSNNYDLSVTANGFTSYTINSSTRILSRNDALSNWVFTGSHAAASSPVINRNSMATLPVQIGIGDTTRCTSATPVTSAITGADSVCVNTSGSAYSVVLNPGNSYIWTITGGTQVSGTNTESITVDWGADAIVGEVSVTEQNGCSYGVPQTLSVTIHTLPVSSISGNDNLVENSTGESYSVVQTPGYTYNWTISGGTQVSGTNTNSITVDWGAAGNAQVQVEAVSACGTSTSTTLDVTLFALIQSIGDGAFNSTSTWNCACVPGISSNVVISSGDSVHLTANANINNVTIENNGVLDGLARQLTIYGDLTNNGRYRASGRLNIRGTLSSIYGTGDYSNLSGQLRFFAGVHEISSEVVIDKPGALRVQAAGTVENHGYVRLAGNLVGANATTSVFTNKAGGNLLLAGTVLTNGVLNANETGNTVTYEETGTTNQSIKQPSSGEYYNLVIDGNNVNSDKLLLADVTILGDLTLVESTFDVSTSSYNVELHGNWNNTGGSFTPRFGTVTFGGSGTQVINHASLESFNDVAVNSGSSVLLRTPIDLADDLVINSGGSLDVNDTNNYQLSIAGDLTSNGTLETRMGNILLDGTGNQNLNSTGSVDFYELTLNNTSGATMQTGSYSLESTIYLTAGTLTTNNDFTFLSTSSGTARIDEITGSGDINNDIIMERYVPNGDAGWRFFGSAVNGVTLNDWEDDVVTTGFPGADYPTFSFTSIYTYDETDTGSFNNGYTAPTNVTNSINVGEGYWVYCSNPLGGSSGFTVDLPGNPNTGTIVLPVTFTSSGGASNDGWNMVSNPFASTIDWDDGSWTKTNVNSGIQIWDNVGMQYASYVTGVGGTNGGTNLIASSQAFWVQTNNTSPSLVAPESVKTTSNQSFIRNSSPGDQITIQVLGQNGFQDELLLNFNENSSWLFDANFDARKLYSSSNAVPSIAIELDSIDLSIQSIPAVSFDSAIAIKALVHQSGNYELKIHQRIFGQSVACLQLEDTYTSNLYDITSDTTISVYLHDSTTQARFLLHVGASPVHLVSTISCKDEMDGQIISLGQGSGPWDYTWYDGNGSVIKSTTQSFTADSISGLSSGNYTIRIENSGVCGTVMDTITLSNPVSLIANFETANGSVFNVDEKIQFSSLSQNAETFEWNFGDGNVSNLENPEHSYDTPGEYVVQLNVTNDKCTRLVEKTLSISDIVPGIKEGIVQDEIIVYQQGDYIYFNSIFDTNEKVRLSIGNLLGQEIFTKEYQGGEINDQVFIPNLNPGILYVSLTSESKKISKKIPIE